MSSPAITRKYLTRKEAADHLTEHWFRTSVATLVKYANQGVGPRYTNGGPNGGGHSRYLKADLDAWAAGTDHEPKAKKAREAFKPRGALSALTR